MSKSSFIADLNVRIQEAERVIAHQNENLAALRRLLQIEMGDSGSKAPTPKIANGAQTHADVDFKGKTSDIILALVRQTGESGIKPRDIAATLLEHNLIQKGSNAVYSYLSEFKKKGLVRQKSEGLYVASTKPIAVTATTARKSRKKRKLSPEGLEAIRKAQKARWAAKKAKS